MTELTSGRAGPAADGSGISVILCTHNGARVLPPTLEHLAAQELPPSVPWEVIVVDNASGDNTREVVLESWPRRHDVPLKLLYEPVPGRSFALRTGVQEARYPCFCILDDDNWLAPDYLARAHRIMSDHPEVAICGGNSIEVLETEDTAPWFDAVKRQLAVGPQGTAAGYVPERRGYLRGAGSVVRTDLYRALFDNGFTPNNICRRGEVKKSGEDTEFCAAVTMLGWKLWYEPEMVLRHYIPAGRMSWCYFLGHNRAGGRAGVGIDPYRFARRYEDPGPYRRLLETWPVRILHAALQMLRYPGKLVRYAFSPLEGDEAAFHFERQMGRIQEIWRLKTEYGTTIRRVREARWRRSARPQDLNGPAPGRQGK